MSEFLDAAASAAGSLISGAFSARSSRKQMKFQERMANTQYQRAAKDLEAAGLNRILALGNPASAPGGAAASMPDLGATLSSARQTNAASRLANASAQVAEGTAPATIKRAEHEAATAALQSEIAAQLLRQEKVNADKAEATRGLYEAGKPAVEKVKDFLLDVQKPGGVKNLLPEQVTHSARNLADKAESVRDRISMSIGDFFDRWSAYSNQTREARQRARDLKRTKK